MATGLRTRAQDKSPKSPHATQPTNADLESKIAALSTMIGEKLDKITTEVSSINRKFAELEESVQFNSDKLAHIELRELPKLQSSIQIEVANLEKKITMMEIYNRKANLLFYGIVQESREENIMEILKSKVFTTLGLTEEDAAKIAIINAHRLPRRDTSGSKGPNPIIAKFCYMQDRDRILSLYEAGERNRSRADGNHRRVNLWEKNTRTPNKLLQKVFQRFLVVFNIKNNILKVPQNPTSGKP